jgi:cytochrome c biogenesis protein CcmG, thiol:disulfide interchange protein DsbE
MSRRIRLAGQVAAVAVVAALLGLLGWKLAQGESEVTSQLGRGGTPTAPHFALERLDGKGELSLSSLRGQPVVLNFWASWCGPCKDEAPVLQAAAKRWRSKDIAFVGVDVKDFRGDARDFLARYGVTYPNVYDGKGSTVGRYGVKAFPETYFVNAAGKVVYRIAGAVEDAEEIDEAIRRTLAPA